MSEELAFLPSEAILSNITELSRLESTVIERKICEIRELVVEFVELFLNYSSDGLSTCEILSIISENLHIHDYEIHSGALDENISRIRSYLSSASVIDRAELCRTWTDEMQNHGISITESDFLVPEKVSEKFIYVKNAYSDEAFEVFSQGFDNPIVIYAKDFKSALAAVSRGDAGFCLLPLEERGARLPTVSELIFKGDFKIVSSTPVFGFDGSADMKYALISRSFLHLSRSIDDDRYLEIRISQKGDISVSELLAVANALGIGIYKISTEQFGDYENRQSYFSVIFREDGGSFVPLLTYLTLFSVSYIPVGIYKNLE